MNFSHHVNVVGSYGKISDITNEKIRKHLEKIERIIKEEGIEIKKDDSYCGIELIR